MKCIADQGKSTVRTYLCIIAYSHTPTSLYSCRIELDKDLILFLMFLNRDLIIPYGVKVYRSMGTNRTCRIDQVIKYNEVDKNKDKNIE